MAPLEALEGRGQEICLNSAVESKQRGHAKRTGQILFEALEKTLDRTEQNRFD